MNRKINKITTWLAAAIFLLALAINVKVTLDDPFMMLSDEAIAQTTTGSETSGSRIICKCTLMGKCKADGGSSVCAQSEPGGNIHCDDYNGNC